MSSKPSKTTNYQLPITNYQLQITNPKLLFMQNKPNLLNTQMNVNTVLITGYDKRKLGKRGKNEPNSNPIAKPFLTVIPASEPGPRKTARVALPPTRYEIIQSKPKQTQRTLIAAPDRDTSAFVIAQTLATHYNGNTPVGCGNRAEPERPIIDNTIRNVQIEIAITLKLFPVKGFQTVIKVEFEKDWAPAFEKAGLKSFEDFFDYSAGQTINKNKKREVVAMTTDTAGTNKELFMKRFFRPHFKDMLFTIRNFGSLCSQAACEWKNAKLLLQKGIATYHPVCYGQQMHFGIEKKSFIITEKINGPPLTDFVAANWLRLDQPQKEIIINALAKFVRKIHNAGISLPDLYLWHIFMTKTPLPDELSEDDLAVIDLHRMRINVSNRNARIKDLGALDFSLSEKYFDENLRELFLNAYANTEAAGQRKVLSRKIRNRARVLSSRRRRPDY